MTPWEFVNNIREKTGDLVTTESEEKSFSKKEFIINRAFSFSPGTIHMANYMNQFPNLPGKMKYDFYYNLVPKGKRYDKWLKDDVLEDVKLIREYYRCNYSKAKTILGILSTEQVDHIRLVMDK